MVIAGRRIVCYSSGMARQLRHHYAGGWYHITTRGMGRRAIFGDDRDREHFIELLAGMVGRYGVILHAYALMENHYHLKASMRGRLRESPPRSRSAGRRSLRGCAKGFRNVWAGRRTPGRGDGFSLSRR